MWTSPSSSLFIHVAVIVSCCLVLLLSLPSSLSAAHPLSTEELALMAAMSSIPPVPQHWSPAQIDSMMAPADVSAIVPGRLNSFNFSRPEGSRLFYLYVPSSYDSSQAYPLFFYFHGYQGDWQQGLQLNMTLDAERAGYFLILGQGTFASTGQRGWNGGVCCLFNQSTIVDDVQFARTALQLVQAAANIDKQRVYTTGWSNGGFMSERLGCEAADIFAGVAADASAVGILPGGKAGLASCDRSFGTSAINYLHFHGTADSVVSWTGSTANPYPGALEDVARWNSRLDCGAELHQTYNDGTFSNLVWPQCRNGRELHFMSVRDGQHWWWTTQQGAFNTTGYVLDFFTRTYNKQHHASTAASDLAVTPITSTPPIVRARRDPPVPPKQGAIASGVYRNIFVEAGYAQADIDKRLQTIAAQLIGGDPKTQTIVYPAQDPTVNGSYVLDVNNNDVRTEGMSYGMMWAVQLNNQTLFDRIFTWYKRYMQHPPGDVQAGFASWHCRQNGEVIDAGPAPDGETWTITALIFATRRWGDSGRINYTFEAEFVTTSAINKEGPECGRRGCQGVQNLFGGADDSDPPMVRFSPTTTDASYQLPSFYEQWSYSPAGLLNFSYWRSVVNQSRAFFHNVTHPVTGLNPNMANWDGSPARFGPIFSFDAWRTARNIAVDVAWYAVDYEWQVGFCNRLLSFFHSLPTWPNYGSEFMLNGTVTDRNHAPGLLSMNAVCSLASNDTIAWDFVDQLWNTPTPSGQSRYYDGALYLEAWLHLSGNFRAFWPQQQQSGVNKHVDME